MRKEQLRIKHSNFSLVLLLLPLFLATGHISLADQQSRGQRVRVRVERGQEIDLYDESHALVVGISDYNNGWPELPGVLGDVKEVSAALQKHGFQVTVKLDLKQDELDRALRTFVGTYGQRPNNRLVIYFAGHGHTLTTRDGRPLGYIVPADAPVPKEDDPGSFKSLAISMSDIEKFAREIESKHALFVFDSCFSGSLFRVRSSGVPDSISDLTDKQVRQFITAGTEKQTVPDVSVFRRQFVRALAGEADYDHDGFITGSELGYFLRVSVTDQTRKMQTPESGKIRDPDLNGGDIVFVAPSGSKTRPASPLPQATREEVRPASVQNSAPSTPDNGGRRTVSDEKAESHLLKCRQRYKESKEAESIQTATEALREAISECDKAKKLGSSDPLITEVSEDPRAKNLN